jgi:hypothetical protein
MTERTLSGSASSSAGISSGIGRSGSGPSSSAGSAAASSSSTTGGSGAKKSDGLIVPSPRPFSHRSTTGRVTLQESTPTRSVTLDASMRWATATSPSRLSRLWRETSRRYAFRRSWTPPSPAGAGGGGSISKRATGASSLGRKMPWTNRLALGRSRWIPRPAGAVGSAMFLSDMVDRILKISGQPVLDSRRAQALTKIR